MSRVDVPVNRLRFGQTSRRDNWWVGPMVVVTILGGFVVYSMWAAFQNAHYEYGNYLSPFYSPVLFGPSHHAFFGAWPSWWPTWLPASPAILILWAPAGFRFTCYYYRGAYYKAFWADPPACAVGEPRTSYRGEHKPPLILQNVHRYFLYLALLFLFVLAYDAWKSMWFEDGFGIGVGTIILTLNVVLLSGYTLGCHSFRHLVGGCLDCPSEAPARHAAYKCSSALNKRHMLFAWMSLFGVVTSDVYVRLLSMGVIPYDLRLI